MTARLLAALALTGLLAATADPQFDAATIKLNPSGFRGGTAPGARNGRFNAGNLPLKTLISYAYGIPEFQVAGPDWLDSQRFDVAAKVPDGTPPDQIAPMLRALLEERFHLQTHRETAEMSYYALTVAKAGSKIKELRPGEPIPPPKFPPGAAMMMTNGTLASFAAQLAPQVGRPVVDKTGLSGSFHIFVTYAPLGKANDAAAVESNPDLFTAIQEQLGLKLDSQKGPVEILKIDHVDKLPVEN